MPYFAKVNNGVVQSVIVADADYISTLDGEYIEAFDDGRRGCYPGPGHTYDDNTDSFRAPTTVNGIPQLISRGQGRRQLKSEGLLGVVEGNIQSLPVDDELRMAYEDAGTWDRQSPALNNMLKMLGKDDAAADAFFISASTIKL